MKENGVTKGQDYSGPVLHRSAFHAGPGASMVPEVEAGRTHKNQVSVSGQRPAMGMFEAPRYPAGWLPLGL